MRSLPMLQLSRRLWSWSLLATVAIHIGTAQAELHAGPMQGYPAMRSAVIWLQTDRTEPVQLAWWPEHHKELRKLTAPILTDGQHQYTALVTVGNLEPETNYRYQIVLDGKTDTSIEPLTFKTAPLWEWREPAPDFKVLTGSCAYINQAKFDRPGTPYGGGYEIYSAMAAQHADLMVWLGDNLYYREADYSSPSGMAARYWHDRALPELQGFLRNTPQVAIWDDHDYGYNDSGNSFIFKGASLELFKNYWANPGYGLPGTSGIFTKVTLNDADFFMLDDRWWRDANAAQDRPGKHMFGKIQMDWLKNALLESTAHFKIIAAGGQMLNNGDAYEGWNHFAYEQTDFLAWLKNNNIKGVIFLTGDRHISELLRLNRPRTYPLYEFTCSPLNSGPAKGSKYNPQRIEGTLVEQRNFCSMSFTGQGKARELNLNVYDSQGRELWKRTLTPADLGYEQIDR